MRFIEKLFYLLLAGSAVWLGGCGTIGTGPAAGTATPEPQLIQTAAAETAAVRLTEVLAKTPSATPPETTATATQTPTQVPGAETIVVQSTQEALSTLAVQGSPTPTAVFGGQTGTTEVEFVADVTVPDGADFDPGEAFTKTWRLRNAGARTWTTAFALVYIDGDRMDAPDRVYLSEDVPPNGMVNISVDMKAPKDAGRYRGYWKLLSADGKFIDNAVYVEIEVIQ